MAQIENVVYRADEFKLEIPSWTFPDEGISCVWGASGAGKSTFLEILSGILPPHSKPRLTLRNKVITDLNPKKRNTGFVFQDFALFPHLTTWENIGFAAAARKLRNNEWSTHATKLVDRLGLRKVANSKASALSGGEQQRVALARALVTKPDLVLLDEPLSSLDEKLRDNARSLIIELSQEYRVPFIMVSHDLRDVRRMAESVLVLSLGKMVGAGSVQEILHRPTTLELAALIPENQTLSVDVDLRICRLAGVKIAVPTPDAFSGSGTLVGKAWNFVVAEKGEIPCSVIQKSDDGPMRSAMVKLDDGQELKACTGLSLEEIKPRMELKVDTASLILFKGSH